MEGADCGVHADATGSMIAFERLPRDEHTSLFSYMIEIENFFREVGHHEAG